MGNMICKCCELGIPWIIDARFCVHHEMFAMFRLLFNLERFSVFSNWKSRVEKQFFQKYWTESTSFCFQIRRCKKKNRSQVYSFRRNVRFFGTNFLVSTLMVSNLLAAIDIVSTKVMTSIVRTIPSKYARLCITGEMCTKSADQSKGHFIRAVGSFMQMNTNTIQYMSNEY